MGFYFLLLPCTAEITNFQLFLLKELFSVFTEQKGCSSSLKIFRTLHFSVFLPKQKLFSDFLAPGRREPWPGTLPLTYHLPALGPAAPRQAGEGIPTTQAAPRCMAGTVNVLWPA